ncbi:MAG: NAD-dependent epimerase/dehydratase family protein [Pseudomonadota bacterium]
MSRRVLIAGCGDVGTAAGLALARSGWAVTGLRRNVAAIPDPIRGLSVDLLDPASLDTVAGAWDALIYCPTPVERSEAGYRAIFVDGLRNVLKKVTAARLLFVSSTAVYGQNDGSVVDEASVTEPAGFNGRILLEAEAVAHAGAAEPVAVRFGGIYGPGRERLLRVASRGPANEVVAVPPQWTNRMHREDCGATLAWLTELAAPERCYNGVDDASVPRHEVLAWIAETLGVQGPTLTRGDGGSQGKRVSNARLRASGFACRYPDYRAGYGPMIAAWSGP